MRSNLVAARLQIPDSPFPDFKHPEFESSDKLQSTNFECMMCVECYMCVRLRIHGQVCACCVFSARFGSNICIQHFAFGFISVYMHDCVCAVCVFAWIPNCRSQIPDHQTVDSQTMELQTVARQIIDSHSADPSNPVVQGPLPPDCNFYLFISKYIYIYIYIYIQYIHVYMYIYIYISSGHVRTYCA